MCHLPGTTRIGWAWRWWCVERRRPRCPDHVITTDAIIWILNWVIATAGIHIVFGCLLWCTCMWIFHIHFHIIRLIYFYRYSYRLSYSTAHFLFIWMGFSVWSAANAFIPIYYFFVFDIHFIPFLLPSIPLPFVVPTRLSLCLTTTTTHNILQARPIGASACTHVPFTPFGYRPI